VGFINPALYKLYESSAYSTAFHDITIGNNTYQYTNAAGNPVTVLGFPALKGWDAVTGIGTPIVSSFVPLIAK
jgi:subtilase family serine protease